jgi:hypothetical protein
MAKELSRKSIDNIPYEHPTSNNNTLSPYQTFSGDGYASQNISVYSTFDSENNYKPSNVDECPVCQKPVLYICDCELKDHMCANNHVWYMSKTGKIITRDPHQ